jgi:hypothetical protein
VQSYLKREGSDSTASIRLTSPHPGISRYEKGLYILICPNCMVGAELAGKE